MNQPLLYLCEILLDLVYVHVHGNNHGNLVYVHVHGSFGIMQWINMCEVIKLLKVYKLVFFIMLDQGSVKKDGSKKMLRL